MGTIVLLTLIEVGYPIGDCFVVVSDVVECCALRLSEGQLVERTRIRITYFISEMKHGIFSYE